MGSSRETEPCGPRLPNAGAVETPRLFLLLNHRFTEIQEADARRSLGIQRVESLPEDLGDLWGHVPPDLDGLSSFLAPFRAWLQQRAAPGDFVLIQGDFGACYLMVRFAMEQNLVPVYATTERMAEETVLENGSVQLFHTFRHRRFRRYGG